jgi:2-polyprenyl-6-methoxyphenol hydroxylase-like FAD-dependent oxidoreductase
LLLARCLRDEGDPERAFTLLERLRRDRIRDVVRQSRRNSARKSMPGPVAAWFRDRILPLAVKLGAKAQQRAYEYRVPWVEA